MKWRIQVASKARWFKYSVMEALRGEGSRRLNGLRGLKRPPVVEGQLKVYPDGML
jgi:hypothetical protein